MSSDSEREKITYLRQLLEGLTGKALPEDENGVLDKAIELFENDSGIGYSQLNEILLCLGQNRISCKFFQYLTDQTTLVKSESAISSLRQFEMNVDAFRKLALVFFGNIKFAYKRLSTNYQMLEFYLSHAKEYDENEFKTRHMPVLPVAQIAAEDTYLLGYLSGRHIEQQLESDPENEEYQLLAKKRDETIVQGKINHNAYLASDHLDVYIATSMREQHEFLFVNRVADEIFNSQILKPLNLRVFDPTQAYCVDRIDKGLAEALMLKRSHVTLYLAQESDTLGKDSELASTLAQGKAVIAYIPHGTPEFVDTLLRDLQAIFPKRSLNELMIQQLQVFEPEAAWRDTDVQEWLSDPHSVNNEEIRDRLNTAVREHYDRRAKTLKESHPLGIQVYLVAGVANGVLVVRELEKCAQLVHNILMNKMRFSIEPKHVDGKEYLLLREAISGSVFRVQTGDELLTNTFWNFYSTNMQ